MVATDIAEPKSADSPALPLSPLKGLVILVIANAVIIGFLGLCGVLKLQEVYAGFAFFLCWLGFDQLKLQKLPHAALGAAVGLLLAYIMHELSKSAPQGAGIFLAAVLMPVIYCQIMGWLTLFINMTTMIIFTIGSIPHIQAQGRFLDMALSLLLAIVYFGGAIAVQTWITTRRKMAAVPA